jgi:hypothetical protein
MKSKIISIQIPEPCAENWDKMTPLEGKRFCGSCQKSVIDFSNATNAEIISILSNTTAKVCGRFRQSQLDYLGYQLMHAPSNGTWRRYAGVLAISAGLFLQGCEQPAMTKGDVVIDLNVSKSINPEPVNKIWGYLFNDFNEAVANEKVAIAGTNLSSVTDSAGRYEIPVDPSILSRYKELIVLDFKGVKKFKINQSCERQDTLKVKVPEVMISGDIILK